MSWPRSSMPLIARMLPMALMLPISIAAAAGETLTSAQSLALTAYENAVKQFKSVLEERSAQIAAHQQLPDLPGQALYLARNTMISTYKDLTDVLPSKIGRPNKFGIPAAYLDADNEPLLDEYSRLFTIMQAPPANAQDSPTPFEDVVRLGTAIARAQGLDLATAQAAGRISLGLFFAETNGHQNIGNARSNTYKGSFQTGESEDQIGQRKWAAVKGAIAAFDPALIARDAKEEARAAHLDHRFNHWTAVRDGLMNAHAALFRQIPAIAKALPAAIQSGNVSGYRVSDPRIMGYLRNNSIFTFGKADRAKTSATYREILDAMWLFNDIFRRALTKFNEITAQQKG